MKPWMSGIAWRLGRLLAVATVCVVLWVWLILFGSGGCGRTPILEDQNKLRQIVAHAIVARELPTKDGLFDPYELVRRGEITRDEYGLFRSERVGTGPTDEEIARGDYTNFPWERCGGDGRFRVLTFPLLWEKKPDKHGGTIVALSDGSVKYCERADFAIRRLVGLAVQSGKLPMKDGAFDPYEFVRSGRIPADLLRPGPTDEEIARGDYTNFPWERYRGDGKLEGPPIPLLWEKKPDENGGCLVALSDGSARYCGREEAEAILRPR